MRIIERRDDGRPSVVELTEAEVVVSVIHGNLMDRGYSQGDALIAMRGSDIPTGLRDPAAGAVLDAVLTPEFSDWLAC